MPSAIEVRKVPIHSVADASELAKLIDDGVLHADRVIAIIGKTEGNGGVNDYTRIIADRAFREVLETKGTRPMDDIRQIPIVWSGGTDGVTRLVTDAPDTAVVVLTGAASGRLGVSAVAAGAQDYLVKGAIDGQLLTRAIRYAVERKRADESVRRLYASEVRAAENARSDST